MAQIKKKGQNKYEIAVCLGRDAQGKRIFDYETFYGTERQVKLRAAELEVELKRRVGPSSLAMNLGEYFDKKWLPGIKDSIGDRTYQTYLYHVSGLKPLVGHLSLYNLNGMVLQDALP